MRMIWQEVCAGRFTTMAASTVLVIGGLFGLPAADAQERPEALTEAAAAPEPDQAPAAADESAPAEGAFSPEELQALVAPIALYPDLVLVLALQASLAPLDIVQAERFLAQYAKDPSLAPDPGWDESVIGLLNYPTVVETMSADLDWTDTLGTAVISQLDGVQDSIQDFRAFMRAIGALESNEQATIIVEGDTIRIEPTDENAVFIPQYDPDALLAALYSTDAALEPAEDQELVEEEEVFETGEPSVEETEEDFAEEGAVQVAAPVAEAAPAVVPAAAPTYYPPPPVTYADPSPSWLGTAATFAGGAAVGGLVGWAIADDDDDDDDGDHYSRGNIDIEDSTIVVNRRDGDELDDLQRRVQDERLEREARERAQREQAKLKVENERLKRDAHKQEQRAEARRQLERRYPEKQQRAAGGGAKDKVSGLAASGSRERAKVSRQSAGGREVAARVDQAKAKAAPERRAAAKARPAKSGKAVRAGDRKEPQVSSAFGGSKSARQVKRESDRGLKSRSGARTALKPSRSDSGKTAFAQRGGGDKAHASKRQRGNKSRRGRR